MEELVRKGFCEAAGVFEAFSARYAGAMVATGREVAGRLRQGGKVLAFGNGGSAAEAQHFAAELVNRLLEERPPLAAVALTTDTSALTAIGNDRGFEQVFERQVLALAAPGDVAVGFTTSGRSPNVLRGLEAGRRKGCLCVGLTGERPGPLGAVCDRVFAVPSRETPRVQECHLGWIHAVCAVIEQAAFGGEEG